MQASYFVMHEPLIHRRELGEAHRRCARQAGLRPSRERHIGVIPRGMCRHPRQIVIVAEQNQTGTSLAVLQI